MKPVFYFDTYKIEGSTVSFLFHYQNADEEIASFCEKFVFPFEIQPDTITQSILKYLHLLTGISYYKSLLGEVSQPYTLSQTEADYLNTIYHNGLGEFAFLNKIEKDIKPFAADSAEVLAPLSLATSGALLGVGGGKDSIVAGEILKRLEQPTTAFSIGSGTHHGQANAVIEVLGLQNMSIERFFDITISDFTNQHQGYHGHVPLSAIIAWIGILAAAQQQLRYVVVANEAASSEANIEWNNRRINHQWSKSLEFEKLTQDFVHKFITPDITYVSLIRPFSSLKILDLLTKLNSAYMSVFTSCNLVLRIDPAARPNGRWCGRCGKCLSTFILLSAVTAYDKVVEIFSKDLLEDMSLHHLLRELLGLEGHKPLDCVGSIEEIRAATRKLIEMSLNKPLLEGLSVSNIPGPDIPTLMAQISEHCLPNELLPAIELLREPHE